MPDLIRHPVLSGCPFLRNRHAANITQRSMKISFIPPLVKGEEGGF